MAKSTAVDFGKVIESMGVMDYGRMWGYRDEFGDEVWLPVSLVNFIRSEQHVGAGAPGAGNTNTGDGQARPEEGAAPAADG